MHEEKTQPLTFDQQYWLDRRAQIIEALAAEGLEIWSDKDRVWLHRASPSVNEEKTEAAGGVGGYEVKLYWRQNVHGWVMTGLVGKGAKWFFGFSRVPADGVALPHGGRDGS